MSTQETNNPYFEVTGNVQKSTMENLGKGSFGEITKQEVVTNARNSEGLEHTLFLRAVVRKRAHYTPPEGTTIPPEILEERTELAKDLLSQEIAILQKLNEKGNSHCPKLLEKTKEDFEMTYIVGEPGNELSLQGNVDTALAVFGTWIEATKALYEDGTLNLDGTAQNFIEIFDREGLPQKAIAIDFGHALEIKEGKIEAPKALASSLWATPPEIAKNLTQSEVETVDAEKTAVFILGCALQDLLGGYTLVKYPANSNFAYPIFDREQFLKDQETDKTEQFDRPYLKAESALLDILETTLNKDPTKRPSLEQLETQINQLIDRKNVGSCVTAETLEEFRRKTKRKKTIVIPEEDVIKIAQQLQEM